jgi:DNA-nicking Smr family endonuclease
MRDVRPLPGPKRAVAPPPPPRPKPRLSEPMAIPAHDPAVPPPLEHNDPSVPRDRMRALRRGDLRPEATLDLHGKTAVEASLALESFVRGALAGGRRCVLVVHGRGHHSAQDGPVLRPLVARLLGGPLSRNVLAFTAAPRQLGGEGATIVLLRRS